MSTYESLKEQRYQHEWVIAGAFPHRLIAVFDASDGWSVRFYVESKGGGNLPSLVIAIFLLIRQLVKLVSKLG